MSVDEDKYARKEKDTYYTDNMEDSGENGNATLRSGAASSRL